MGKLKKAGQISGWLLNAFLAFLLLCNVYMISVRHFAGIPQPSVCGWSWAVVVSGSMEPEICVNDLIIVQKKEDYQMGDIISFESGSSVVTHRIVGMDAGDYLTQGDANNAVDFAPVTKEKVVGKVMYIIPGIGVMIQYLQTPLGMMCFVLLGFLLIEIPYLMDRGRTKKGGRFL